MARIVQTIDDLSGETLNEEVEPTKVTVDGTEYEIDLGSGSKDRFLKWLNGEGALIDYRPSPAKSTTRKATVDDDGWSKEDKAAARHWAIDTGYQFPSATEKNDDGSPVMKTLGDRGRVPEAVLKAWTTAGSPPIPND